MCNHCLHTIHIRLKYTDYVISEHTVNLQKVYTIGQLSHSDNLQKVNTIGQRSHQQGTFTSKITSRATIRTTMRTEVTIIKLERNDKYNWSYTSQLNKDYGQFAPALDMNEYTIYMKLIETFKNACEAFNITYLLEGGSVLGVFRYHGFVPWDDDFDCKVNVSQKRILKKALEGIPGYTLIVQINRHWKLFSNNSSKAGKYSWGWPFIDILFFEENLTHVYDVTLQNPRHFDPKQDILPLGKGIFEGMILPVPHNMEAYLTRKYNMKEPCQSNWWNHKKETGPVIKSSHISCDKLFGVYPVVHRYKIGNASFEELRLGNKILYTVERPSLKLVKRLHT